MTAVLGQAPSTAVHTTDQPEQPTNGFIAVNGRSPTTSALHSRDNSAHNNTTSPYQNGYMNNRESTPSAGEKRRHSQSEGYPPASGQEEHPSKRRSGPPSVTASPSSQFGSAYVSGNSSPVQSSYTTHTGAPSMPASADSQSQYPRSEPYPENRDKQQWRAPSATPGQTSQQNGGYSSDAQIAEAVQRGTQEMASPQSHNSDPKYPSAPAHTSSSASGPPASSGHSHPVGMTQLLSVQKQRKRNFSNRTKTGCLTCRERKKKCDEAKPQCNNCVKGGFQCKGYQPSSAYKAGNLIAQNPQQNLQSRSYDPPHSQAPGYGYPPQAPMPPVGPHSRGHLPPGPPNHHFSPNGVRPGINPPPSNSKHPPGPPPQAPMGTAHGPPPPHPEYPRHGFQEPPRAPHHPETSHDYRPPSRQYPPPLPPIEAWRKEPYNGGFAPPGPGHLPQAPVPPMNGPHHHKQGSWQRKPNSDSIEPRDLAVLALQQQQQQHHRRDAGPEGEPVAERDGRKDVQDPDAYGKPTARHQTEKQNMLDGLLYDPYDPQLAEERRECRKALHNFNNSADSVNFSEAGRRRFTEHFKEILEPRFNVNYGSPSRNVLQKNGSVGERAELSTPFDCTYGYNLTIGDDVELGANLTIDDCAPVTIGNRVVIGKNVSLITSRFAFENSDKGRPRLWRSYGITIEDDVTIEANVTIMPGTTIGRGTVVRCGSKVETTAQDHVVVYMDRYGREAFESLFSRTKHWCGKKSHKKNRDKSRQKKSRDKSGNKSSHKSRDGVPEGTPNAALDSAYDSAPGGVSEGPGESSGDGFGAGYHYSTHYSSDPRRQSYEVPE